MSDVRANRTLDEWAREIHELAVSKGWWNGARSPAEIIANIHSEATEAWEEYRNGNYGPQIRYAEDGKPEGYAVELADTVIRCLDALHALGVSAEDVIAIKHSYNLTRSMRHGGKLA